MQAAVPTSALMRAFAACLLGSALAVLPAWAQDTEPPPEPPAAAPVVPEAAPEPPPLPSEPPAAPSATESPAPAEEIPPTTEAPRPTPPDEAAVQRPAATEPVHAAESPHYPLRKPEPQSWSFAGVFGKYDTAQLQRGFQVYREVCATCHSLSLVPFRALGSRTGPYYTEEQVRSLAAEYQIQDGPNDEGEMFERPGRASDYFPAPFPNAQAAAAANNGAAPPDLSLMAKARGVSRGFPWFLLDAATQYQEGGVDYIHALLTGYEDPPEGVTAPEGTYYNPYFASGPALAMPPPLQDGQVTYGDGSPETVDQYARDVAAFLMWTAEPNLVDRKRIGFQVMIFLIAFAALMYLTKQRVWSKQH